MSIRLTLGRRAMAAAGALGLAAAVVAGTALHVEDTSAAWTDSEVGQAGVSAAWPVGWAGVQAARIYTPKIQHGSFGYNTLYRSQVKNFGTTTFNSSTSARAQMSDESNRQTLISGTPTGANGVVKDSSSRYVLQDGFPGGAGVSTPVALSSQGCSFVAPNYVPAPSSADGKCGASTGDFSAASHTLNSFGFQMDERGGAGDSFVNAWGLKTGVKCGLSSASVTALEGQVDVTGIGNLFGGPPKYNSSQTATIWKTSNGTSNSQLSENLDTYNVVGVNEGVRYRPLVRTITQQNPPYALAEIGFYLDTYDGAGWNREPASKFYFSLSRSECGVRNVQPGGSTAAPERAAPTPALDILTNTTFPTNDTPFSGFQGASTLASPAQPSSRMAEQARAAEAPAAEALSTTAPQESATGTETTTSAPPEPGATTAPGAAENTSDAAGAAAGTSAVTGEETKAAETSTTAETSAPTIPAKPDALPEDTEKCGTVEVDGEKLDAVIAEGTECDSNARRAASRALAAYIAEGTQDSRWKVFASENSTADGWRWAAIDTKTGQVVYVE